MYHLDCCPNQPKRQVLAVDCVQLSFSVTMTYVTSVIVTKFERYQLQNVSVNFYFKSD
jgi:hypothetical protein